MVGVEAAWRSVLHRHGKSIREIARETGVARNTIRRYLRDEEAASYKPRPPRSTKLDPFKAYITERVGSAAPEWIPASVLLMELRERGYCGGYTMLQQFVASLRPKQVVEKVERFIRYLRHSYYVPLASRLAQEGLIVDRWYAEYRDARATLVRAEPAPLPSSMTDEELRPYYNERMRREMKRRRSKEITVLATL